MKKISENVFASFVCAEYAMANVSMPVILEVLAHNFEFGVPYITENDTSDSPGKSYVAIYESGWILIHWFPGVKELLVSLCWYRFKSEHICKVQRCLSDLLSAEVVCIEEKRFRHSVLPESCYPGYSNFILC